MVDWFAELDVAARMEELDNSGFLLDKHHCSLKLWVRRLLLGIMKIFLAKFKRKIHVLDEPQSKNKFPMLTVRQILFQIFSFFNTNKTQGHTMNLSDLLNVDLYNDNLKMLNHSWEETSVSLVDELDTQRTLAACSDGHADSLIQDKKHLCESARQR